MGRREECVPLTYNKYIDSPSKEVLSFKLCGFLVVSHLPASSAFSLDFVKVYIVAIKANEPASFVEVLNID